MATFNLYHDTRRVKDDGTAPVKIKVHHNKKTILINLNVSVRPGAVINNEVVLPDVVRAKTINRFVKAKLISIEDTLNKLMLTGKLDKLTDKELKVILEGGELVTVQESLVKDVFQQFIGLKTKKNTIDSYTYTLSSIAKYANIEILEFKDINNSWLRGFEKFLSKTSSINSIAIHLRNLRSVFNFAINEDLIEQNAYPFRKYRIKKEKTRKRSLTADQLITLRDYPCEEHQEKYRDMFMLIFYLIGINTVDLFSLKKINNGKIEYRRAKTARLYTIKVEPEAMAIIEKYKGKNQLLDVLDNYANYKDFAHRLNNNLKKIGEVKLVERKGSRGLGKKEYDPLFPELTTYWARHTWATIASELEIPKETIAAALGHGGNTVTDIYINFDQKKIDLANRKVLDYLKR